MIQDLKSKFFIILKDTYSSKSDGQPVYTQYQLCEVSTGLIFFRFVKGYKPYIKCRDFQSIDQFSHIQPELAQTTVELDAVTPYSQPVSFYTIIQLLRQKKLQQLI
jgi:hypothetical protein